MALSYLFLSLSPMGSPLCILGVRGVRSLPLALELLLLFVLLPLVVFVGQLVEVSTVGLLLEAGCLGSRKLLIVDSGGLFSDGRGSGLSLVHSGHLLVIELVVGEVDVEVVDSDSVLSLDGFLKQLGVFLGGQVVEHVSLFNEDSVLEVGIIDTSFDGDELILGVGLVDGEGIGSLFGGVSSQILADLLAVDDLVLVRAELLSGEDFVFLRSEDDVGWDVLLGQRSGLLQTLLIKLTSLRLGLVGHGGSVHLLGGLLVGLFLLNTLSLGLLLRGDCDTLGKVDSPQLFLSLTEGGSPRAAGRGQSSALTLALTLALDIGNFTSDGGLGPADRDPGAGGDPRLGRSGFGLLGASDGALASIENLLVHVVAKVGTVGGAESVDSLVAGLSHSEDTGGLEGGADICLVFLASYELRALVLRLEISTYSDHALNGGVSSAACEFPKVRSITYISSCLTKLLLKFEFSICGSLE